MHMTKQHTDKIEKRGKKGTLTLKAFFFVKRRVIYVFNSKTPIEPILESSCGSSFDAVLDQHQYKPNRVVQTGVLQTT